MSVYSFINDLPSEPVSYLGSPSVTYPEDTQVATFGPIYLPKIYGKDLTAFEIASSGKIAVTIQDFYSLDLDRPSTHAGFSNVTMFQTKSNGSLLLSTTNSNASIFLNGEQGKITFSGSNAFAGDIELVASNAFLKVANDKVDAYAGSNFTVLASNGVTLSVPSASVTMSNGTAHTTACNAVITSSNATLTSLASTTVSASNALRTNATWSTDHFGETVTMTGGIITSTADTKHDFFIYGEGTPRFSIDNTGASLNGNLRISGTIDSVNTTETNLQVFDKLIKVAVSDPAGTPLTDADASGAGLKVEGAAATTKSLLWQFEGAYANLATDAGRDDEPAWELKGGGLRFSHSNVSFKMRLGEGGELELVKKVGTAPAKLVARFGRTLL